MTRYLAQVTRTDSYFVDATDEREAARIAEDLAHQWKKPDYTGKLTVDVDVVAKEQAA